MIENADFSKADAEDDASVYRLAELISQRHRFAIDAGGRLHVYRDGYYQPNAESMIRCRVKRIMERLHAVNEWSSHKGEEVIRCIAVDAPELPARPSLEIVNLQNGLLNVLNRRLEPHSPDWLTNIQLPIRFDPEARCQAWDNFIAGVFPADAEAIAWEILAWLMTPDTSIQKAILLTGEGANGKSTFLRAVVAFIGNQNVSALGLQKLESDRFSVARLLGKLANICSDLPAMDLDSTSMFKSVTGGDVIVGERKFHDSFEFIPFTRLIFSANHPPRSKDASAAFYRRWLVIPFERVFEAGASNTVPRERLDADLSDPTELSGALNKALLALASLRQKGFSDTESVRRALDSFRQATDPLTVWLGQNVVRCPSGTLPMEVALNAYNRDALKAGRPLTNKTALGLAIGKLEPKIEKAQRTVNGVQNWCYLCIQLQIPGHRS